MLTSRSPEDHATRYRLRDRLLPIGRCQFAPNAIKVRLRSTLRNPKS